MFSLSWDAVDGAAKYEVQYTTDAADAETVTWTALDAVMGTAQTYTPTAAPACGDVYRFRVRAFGDGETVAAVWGTESAATAFAPNCPPVFTSAPYAFSVAEDAAQDAAVGTVTATDPDAGDTVTYALTAGNTGKRLRPGREHRGHHRGGGAGPRDGGQLPPDGRGLGRARRDGHRHGHGHGDRRGGGPAGDPGAAQRVPGRGRLLP